MWRMTPCNAACDHAVDYADGDAEHGFRRDEFFEMRI